MNIALIAHDQKKDDMVAFAKKYTAILGSHQLYATGTTGLRIMEATGLSVIRLNSGPLGGDQQIGGLVSERKMDLIIFLRDPLTSQPHEPDVNALLRLCDVYNVPLATNITGAHIMMEVVQEGWIDIQKVRLEN